MRLPRLIVITDWELPGIEQKLRALAALGDAIAFQHRAPQLAPTEFATRARWLSSLGVPVFINGQPELAAALGAHLHLPDGAVTATQCRPLIRDRLISVAVHQSSAPPVGADLALVSPVFSPGSKPHDTRALLGIAGFDALARALPCPAYALGGVSAKNVGQLRSAAGVAVISSVLKAADPLSAARELLAALGDGA